MRAHLSGRKWVKILLVDDSQTIRNLEKNIPARRGHTDVIEAAHGVEALSLTEADHPDLVPVDWNMPNMDGLTLLREVREKDRTLPIGNCERTRCCQSVDRLDLRIAGGRGAGEPGTWCLKPPSGDARLWGPFRVVHPGFRGSHRPVAGSLPVFRIRRTRTGQVALIRVR